MTPTETAIAPSAPQISQNGANRVCPGCGAEFAPGGRGMGKVFCEDKCRTGFANRMKAEGGPLAAFIKAWTMTRHAKAGTREAEICRYARTQITQISSYLNDKDREAGRPPALDYVETLMQSGSNYMDRIR